MARASLVLLLAVYLFVMISVAESNRLTAGFGGKRTPTLVCESVYGAEEGDTCTSVATQFKQSLNSFLSINPNINCNSFFVGQWLCVKGAPK